MTTSRAVRRLLGSVGVVVALWRVPLGAQPAAVGPEPEPVEEQPPAEDEPVVEPAAEDGESGGQPD